MLNLSALFYPLRLAANFFQPIRRIQNEHKFTVEFLSARSGPGDKLNFFVVVRSKDANHFIEHKDYRHLFTVDRTRHPESL